MTELLVVSRGYRVVLMPNDLLVLMQVSYYSDSLQAGRYGDRILVWARFSAPVHSGPGAHRSLYAMGTGSFPGVKRPGCGAIDPIRSSA